MVSRSAPGGQCIQQFGEGHRRSAETPFQFVISPSLLVRSRFRLHGYPGTESGDGRREVRDAPHGACGL